MIKEKIQKTLDFFVRMRRGGTTTLIKKIYEGQDVYVFFPDESHKKTLKALYRNPENLISPETTLRTIGKKPKPILVDNHTMLHMLQEVLMQFAMDERTINDLKIIAIEDKREIDNWRGLATDWKRIAYIRCQAMSQLSTQISKMKSNHIQKLRRKKHA